MGWKGTDPAKWAREVQQLNRDVFRESVQELGIVMSNGQGKQSGPGVVPVVTGNLANSVLVQKGTMPTVDGEDAKHIVPDLSAAQTLEIGDVAFVGYQAGYARRVNYGFVGEDSLGRTYNQAGRGFVEAAAARWKSIVDAAIITVRGRSGR